MGGKIQSMVIMLMNAIAAVLLLAASVYEFMRGETAMAAYALFAMICAVAISWYTRKPYHPRIRYRQ